MQSEVNCGDQSLCVDGGGRARDTRGDDYRRGRDKGQELNFVCIIYPVTGSVLLTTFKEAKITDNYERAGFRLQ